MRLPTICFLIALFLAGCNQPRDVRAYYFPVREMVADQGLVYVYDNTGSLPGPAEEFIYYLGVDLDTALYLSTTKYGPDLAPAQLGRERIQNEAVYLEQLTLMLKDSTGVAHPVNTDILYDRIFPFYPEDDHPCGYRTSYSRPDTPDATTFVTLDRIFRGDTTVTVMGKDYDAIVFELAGEVSVRDAIEGDISPSFGGYEIYARGLGRVAYRRDLGEGLSLGGRLKERISMAEFTERVGKERR